MTAKELGKQHSSTLTKRGYFAILIMQGIVFRYDMKEAAEISVRYADALLKELAKEE